MKSLSKLYWALLLMAMSPLANAGRSEITATWEASSTAIPTLGTWSLLAMAGLMAVVGIRLMKNHATGARVISVVLLAGGLVLGAQQARTGLGTVPVSGGDCSGGDVTYRLLDFADLVNECPNPLEITDYEYPDPSEFDSECFTLNESCPIGSQVGPDDSCRLNYYVFTGGPGCDDS